LIRVLQVGAHVEDPLRTTSNTIMEARKQTTSCTSNEELENLN